MLPSLAVAGPPMICRTVPLVAVVTTVALGDAVARSLTDAAVTAAKAPVANAGEAVYVEVTSHGPTLPTPSVALTRNE